MNVNKRPRIVKVFGSKASLSDYLPVKFGTNIVINKNSYEDIANTNFVYGMESLEKDLQLKDLNSVLYYQGSLLSYLFHKGVAEFSTYQDYSIGSLATYKGDLYIATKDIKATSFEKTKDPCDPCSACEDGSDVCLAPEFPSRETGWCKIVTHCTYDTKMDEIENTFNALNKAIKNIKGVKSFGIFNHPTTKKLELVLSLDDGTDFKVPMNKFGDISLNPNTKELTVSNPDGTKIVLPRYVAHNELDINKGFRFNTGTGLWEVNLKDFVDAGSGLTVNNLGKILVKASDLVDGTTIIAGSNNKFSVSPIYTKNITDAIDNLKKATDVKFNTLATNGAKVYASNPIGGDGTKANPLTIKLANNLIVDSKGNLTLNDVQPEVITNFKTHPYRYGFHTFQGSNSRVIGLPAQITSNLPEQPMLDTVSSETSYDFQGYYIASNSEIGVWIHNSGHAFFVANDHGLERNQVQRDSSAWGNWQKLDNTSNITTVQVTNMQNQINSLNTNLTARTNDINKNKADIASINTKLNATCKTKIKNINGNYTIVDTDNTIISTSTSNITITLNPTTVPVGRTFTVIQGGTGKITFKGASGTVIPPFEGTLVTAGQNAVVSVLFESTTKVRLMGQTVRR